MRIFKCKHKNNKTINQFDYDGCGGMVVWCQDCGAYSIHDEYDHDYYFGKEKKWEWILPKQEK